MSQDLENVMSPRNRFYHEQNLSIRKKGRKTINLIWFMKIENQVKNETYQRLVRQKSRKYQQKLIEAQMRLAIGAMAHNSE